MNCKFCDRVINNKGALATHEPYCKSNPNKVIKIKPANAGAKKGSIPWNKGLTTPQDVRDKIANSLKGVATGKGSTPEKELERKKKITEKAKLNNGGHRQGSGRGKKGWYKGFFCDSSWELAFIIYCLDNGIEIARNTDRRTYEWEGKSRTYIPDFIVEGVVTEVKGYKTEQWLAKHEANPDVEVLYEKELRPILDYVKDKYGKDFINLYESGGG